MSVISVKEACKSYSKNGSSPVLDGFTMTVQRGTIYSLLGASGCGKTTVLQCCVGLRKLDSGNITIFGGRPGSKESGVPGKRIGYMPQELSLYSEFTIQESLEYFGRVYGMPKRDIQVHMTFLIKFLDLPDSKRRISTLSGGQKRRVSFAVALIHDPELLILDEPTVGVDPLLRESIWRYLIKLSSGNTTIIITTHYVEEARKSDTIGLMRNGRLLVEKNPNALLQEYNTNLLEDIVLKFCLTDNGANTNTTSASSSINSLNTGIESETAELQDNSTDVKSSNRIRPLNHRTSIFEGSKDCVGIAYVNKNQGLQEMHANGNGMITEVPEAGITIEQTRKEAKKEILHKYAGCIDEWNLLLSKLSALIIKNYIVLMRNIGFLLFVFFVPSLQIVIICLAIGNDPKHLNVAVINHEVGIAPCEVEKGCGVGNLSCRYLDLLPKESIKLIPYLTEKEALTSIKEGHLWGYMSFPKNYSKYIMERAVTGNFATNETLDGSRITFNLDMSNKQIGQTMKKIFFDAFQKYIIMLLTECDYDPKEGEIPLFFDGPVYGTDDTSFREFLAPSVLLGLLFFFPLCASGISYISDKKIGTLERSLVAGVTTCQIMTSYLLTQVVVLVGQSALAFIILTWVFGIQIHGATALAILLSVLIGIGGMSMGFLIATFCNEEVEAVLLAIGSFFPNFLLAGMVWPIQGMPVTLQYFSYLLPCTLACESMRSIVSRGWNITHQSVWPGFVSTILWIIVYWILTIMIHRFSKRRR